MVRGIAGAVRFRWSPGGIIGTNKVVWGRGMTPQPTSTTSPSLKPSERLPGVLDRSFALSEISFRAGWRFSGPSSIRKAEPLLRDKQRTTHSGRERVCVCVCVTVC